MTTDTRMKLALRARSRSAASEVTLAAHLQGLGHDRAAAGDDDRRDRHRLRASRRRCSQARCAAAMRRELQQPHRRRRHEHQRRVFALANGLARQPADRRGRARSSTRFAAALTDSARSWRGRSPPTARAPPSSSRSRSPARPTDGHRRATSRKAIAGSTLVKAAMFGADPNWGRVLATVGARAGSPGATRSTRTRRRSTIQGIVRLRRRSRRRTTPDGAPGAHARAARCRSRSRCAAGDARGHRVGLRPLATTT